VQNASQSRHLASRKQLSPDLSIILDSLQDAILSVDAKGRIQLANAAATCLFGFSRAELVGMPVERLHADPGSARRFQAGEDPLLKRDGLAEGDYVMRGPAGRLFPAETMTVLLRDDDGKEHGRILVVRDISHRKRSEEQLRRRTRQLMVLHEVGSLVNRSLDLDQVLSTSLSRLRSLMQCEVAAFYLASDAGSRDLLRLRQGSGLPKPLVDRMKRRTPRPGHSPEARAAATREIVFVEEPGSRSRLDAALLPEAGIVSAAYVPVESPEGLVGVLLVGRTRKVPFSGEDVDLFLPLAQLLGTAIGNARLFADLQRHRELLARLSSRILTAQEEERQHLSRELHDGIGQSLSALKLGLEMIPRDAAGLPAAVQTDLQRTLEIVKETISELRRIALDLRPSMLDDLGLIPTLKWLAQRFQEQTGIVVRLDARGKIPRLSAEQEVNLYRIVQEALSNVVKHAEADRVTIRVRSTVAAVHLLVGDHGRGFQPDRAPGEAGHTGLGLVGIEERVNLMDGRFRFRSRPDKGTLLAVQIPLRPLAAPRPESRGAPDQEAQR
jgi:PAS domain S-box-containing protein